MSPKGRVKVARAGLTTNARAVVLTLLEIAAIGRATTKNALPITVATKQAGRTRTTSATTLKGSGSSAPKLGLAQPIASTQRVVNSLVFICFNHSLPADVCLTKFCDLAGDYPFGDFSWLSFIPSLRRRTDSTRGTNICVSQGQGLDDVG